MQKKEIIWREVLFQAIEKNKKQFTQKELAQKLGCSLSTVFNALKVPRQTGAINVRGRFFTLVNIEKLLIIWATQRNLEKEIIYKARVNLSPLKIEAEMPANIIYTAFSAYRLRFKEIPADYDKVYVYSQDLNKIMKRFPKKKTPKRSWGVENLIVIKADDKLGDYGPVAPLAQIYVDLWNLKEWYAQDFLEALKKKIS